MFLQDGFSQNCWVQGINCVKLFKPLQNLFEVFHACYNWDKRRIDNYVNSKIISILRDFVAIYKTANLSPTLLAMTKNMLSSKLFLCTFLSQRDFKKVAHNYFSKYLNTLTQLIDIRMEFTPFEEQTKKTKINDLKLLERS